MPEPPRLARLLLTWALPRTDRSRSILGDLREEFVRRASGETDAPKRARRWYVRAALSLAIRYALERARGVGGRLFRTGPGRGGRGLLAGLLYDARHTVRGLMRSPGLTLMAILALALGIGINAGIFAHVDAISFRPLSAEEPERLVALYGERRDQRRLRFSYPDWLDYREGMADAVEGLAGFVGLRASLADGESAVMVWTELVTSNWFDVVRPKMEIGRRLLPDDEEAVVLSHAFWTRHFGGSPDVLGRSVSVNGQPFTVVGVTGSLFSGTRLGAFAPELWMPVRVIERVQPGVPYRLDSRDRDWLIMIGRLKDGVSAERARAAANRVATALGRTFPASHAERSVRLVSNEQPENAAGFGASAQEWRYGGLVAMGAVALVLLIACANVASLQFARALGRRREVAVRMSLGASRVRVIGQAVVESLVLAMVAGFVGIAVARLIIWVGGAFEPPLEFRGALDVAIEWRVVAFTLAVSVVAGVVAAALPAWRESRADPAASMQAGGGGSPRSPRMLDGLVVAQVAFSFVVLIGAALFVQSLERRRGADPGFPLENGLMLTVDPSLGGADAAEIREFYRRVLDDLKAVPGVVGASRATSFPLSGTRPPTATVETEAETAAEGGVRSIWYAVEPGWFETLGATVVEGRDFTLADSAGMASVVIVNRALAALLFPGADAVGRRVRVGESVTAEVVGLVPDFKVRNLIGESQPFVARSLPQTGTPGRSTIMIRTVAEPSALVSQVRTVVADVDPTVAIIGPETLEEGTEIQFVLAEAAATGASVFGLLALLLTVAGLYGLMAHSVERRMQEIGIRMALGGHANLVTGMVLRRGVILALVGTCIGLAIALALSRIIARVVWGVSPTDPFTYAVVTALVIAVGGVASWLPARRVAGVDPMKVLRAD